MNIFEVVRFILKSKTPPFLSIDVKIWNRWKWIIYPTVFLNKEYRPCIIYRKEFKFLKNIVVIGLKWNGKNVKRRASGFAKEFIKSRKNAKCIYCGSRLHYGNATTDHIIPISEGGNNAQVNLMVCCFNCNNQRGNMKFIDYLKIKNPKYRNEKNPFV